jgi:Glycosyltransferase family 87
LGMVSTKLLDIEDRIFTAERLWFYGTGVVVAYALSLGWLAFKHGWLVLPSGDMRGIDFGWIWLSGKLAASGEAAKVFDPVAFSAAQLSFYFPSPGSDNSLLFNRFYYPPTFLLFTYPLGLMSYPIACATWIAASLVLYGTAVYAITSRPIALLAAATPFFVIENIDFAQTGFLTAALMGLSLAFMERCPWVSGIFLGLLTYKPHFGLLFPVALLASRNWRALGSAAAATVIISVTAAITFGYDGWASFVDALGDRSPSLGPGAEGEVRLFSIFGLLHWAGASAVISWTVQLAVSAAVALWIGVLWTKPIPYDLRAAALCTASLMVSPYALFYDLCILSIAAAFLVKDGLSRGFLPGERTAMLSCWAALFGMETPTGAIVCSVLMLLCVRRAALVTEASPQALLSAVNE